MTTVKTGTIAATDRGVWRLVARREFVERIRDRGFQVSTAITLLILVGVIVGSSVLGGSTSFDLAYEGGPTVGRQIVASAKAIKVEVHLVPVTTETQASALVRDGRADAAFLDDHVVVKSDGDPQLLGVIQLVSARARTRAALEDAGLSSSDAEAVLDQPPLPVRSLEPLDAKRRENSAVAFVGVLALYGQLFAYGFWVASGVVEEKSSRVVEVLLATVRPSHLLRGKILGIGALGLLQLLTIGVVGLVTAQALGAIEFPFGAIAAIGLVLVWFVLGYFFYAGLFAVAGSLVTRQEDLQATMTPLTLVIVASFFIGINATQNPGSTLATVASLLPPSAPLVMPSQIALGNATALDAVASIAISVGATVALVPVATTIYSRAVLRTGKVRIRSLLRPDTT